MTSNASDELTAAFAGTPVIVPDRTPADLPPAWQPITAAAAPAERTAAALALWNADLCAALPRFSAQLRDRLVDVRLCVVHDRTALAYLTRTDADEPIAWTGYLPAGAAVRQAAFPDTLPAPATEFLRSVHGGFTAPDGESYGPIDPRHMSTFARWRGADGPLDGVDEDATRLMVVATDGGALHYCTSPDLPPGAVAVVDGTEVEPCPDFFDELDQLMAGRFAS
ncbi:hypothetical protein ACQEVB_20465 [Pseudonocardia sp. CA-107938]|uniref:hypothetical protein n=1 Tax=Pseudonocardia sp. CA-107938 TaxID=3240021 RepID=UPI003D8BDF04